MTKYLLSYHGEAFEAPTDPAEAEATMAAWGAWYGSIGERLVDGGAPIAGHTAVGPDGSAADAPNAQLTGFTVIETATLEEATEIAKGCPVLSYGSSVQISEMLEMG